MKLTRTLTILALSFPALGLQAKDTVRDTLGFDKSVSRTPASIIAGGMSGVRVCSLDGSLDGEKTVYIRGVNTLRGNSQPVWIVDGAVLSSSAFENRDLFFRNEHAGRSYTSVKNDMGWLGSYEIESVRVIKDMAEAAKYGVNGANGVIIVTTRKAVCGERNFHLNSNAGIDFLPKTGEAFRSGFFHNHDLGVDGKIGSNSTYKISGFLRDNESGVKGESDRSLGLALSFETRANKMFKFGLNSFLNYDQASSAYGANYIGSTSTMIVSRYPSSFAVDTVEGWLNDYDDNTEAMRSVNSVYLQIDFLPGLWFKASGGLDYTNRNRNLWFGDNTAFGHEVNGAAGLLNNSLLNFNLKGELNYSRNIAVDHHFEIGAAFETLGYFNRTNAMCATNYELPYLRGKGISASSGGKEIRKFSRFHNNLGYYVTLKYDFKGWMGIEGIFRSDHNGKYGAEALRYPAVSAFVDIREMLLPDSRTLSFLRLSGGYGVAGREIDLPYEYLKYYIGNVPSIPSQSDYYFDGVNILKSREYNVGIDAGFFGSRIDAGVRYYGKKTDDEFTVYNGLRTMSDGLYTQAGSWTAEQERVSTIGNNGIEFDAAFGIIRTRSLEWTLEANFTRNFNRILTLDPTDAVSATISKGQYLAAQTEGESVSGNWIPKVHGGLGSTLRVSRFLLDVKLSGAAGFDIINANNILKSPENTLTPELTEKGDYLRLDHVGITYDVPLKTRAIKGLKVSAAAHNILTLTKYSGWNPDVNSYGICVRNAGIDYGSYPLSRSIVLGLNLKF